MGIELVGYAAGLIMAISLMPQLIKSLKTRSTKDISVLWTLVAILGLILWVVYGAGISKWPIIVFAGLEALLMIFLLLLKLRYG